MNLSKEKLLEKKKQLEENLKKLEVLYNQVQGGLSVIADLLKDLETTDNGTEDSK